MSFEFAWSGDLVMVALWALTGLLVKATDGIADGDVEIASVGKKKVLGVALPTAGAVSAVLMTAWDWNSLAMFSAIVAGLAVAGKIDSHEHVIGTVLFAALCSLPYLLLGAPWSGRVVAWWQPAAVTAVVVLGSAADEVLHGKMEDREGVLHSLSEHRPVLKVLLVVLWVSGACSLALVLAMVAFDAAYDATAWALPRISPGEVCE